jgi:hypothetical protein
VDGAIVRLRILAPPAVLTLAVANPGFHTPDQSVIVDGR